ncbi:MAG: DMT family transporter [Planctomycetes bacterium]|nr:DMT family transporter [Planctomycetota bacterium]
MDPDTASLLPVGESAALACAACWALSTVSFTAASRRAGATAVNQFRLLVACVLLGVAFVVCGIAQGFEAAPPTRQALLLSASGVVGLTLGDAALFRAFVILGARRVSLLTALAPVIVALLAAWLLGERIGPVGIAGMALTLAGIAWVVLDRTHGGEAVRGSIGEGIALGVCAALGQAGGAVLSKAGLGQVGADTPLGGLAFGGAHPQVVTPLLGTLLRMLVGTAALLVFTILTGRLRQTADVVRDRTALGWSLAGSVFGPAVGVWLSLVAFAHTEAAIAQTLLALATVLVLPASRFLTGERANPRAYVGAAIAVGGVALLAFRQRFSW